MFGIYPKNHDILEEVKRNRNLFLSEGIAFTLIGIFAILLPTLFSLTLAYFLGWVLVIGAIVVGIRTIRAQEMPNRTLSALSTILYLFLGFMFLAYPISGIMALTLALGCFFVYDGIVKIYSSMHIRPVRRWSWFLGSGIISLVLALMILLSWPTEETWVLGVLIGVNFLSTGLAMIWFLWGLPQSPKMK